MAFVATDLAQRSVAVTGGQMRHSWAYKSTADDIATVRGAGYFAAAGSTTGDGRLKDEDDIWVTASDGSSLNEVSDAAAGTVIAA